jgi:hypothetical protein
VGFENLLPRQPPLFHALPRQPPLFHEKKIYFNSRNVSETLFDVADIITYIHTHTYRGTGTCLLEAGKGTSGTRPRDPERRC